MYAIPLGDHGLIWSARMKASYVHEVACGGALGPKGFSRVVLPCMGEVRRTTKRLRLRCKGLCEAQPQTSSPCGFAQKTQAADCDGLLSPRGRPGADRGGVGVLGVGAVCGLCLYMYIYSRQAHASSWRRMRRGGLQVPIVHLRTRAPSSRRTRRTRASGGRTRH